jgi:hypothetical protein
VNVLSIGFYTIKRHLEKYGKGKLQNFPITNILCHKLYLPYIKGIKLIRPLDFIEFDKEASTQFLVDEFGYQRSPQKHFEYRFTKFYKAYWFTEKFLFGKKEVLTHNGKKSTSLNPVDFVKKMEKILCW